MSDASGLLWMLLRDIASLSRLSITIIFYSGSQNAEPKRPLLQGDYSIADGSRQGVGACKAVARPSGHAQRCEPFV